MMKIAFEINKMHVIQFAISLYHIYKSYNNIIIVTLMYRVKKDCQNYVNMFVHVPLSSTLAPPTNVTSHDL